MDRIGLIGGMSWESSVEYYRLINRGVRERLGGLHSASCLLYSVDFAPIEAMQRAGQWRELGVELANIGRTLENAGATALLLCTNTMHKCAPEIESAVRIPLMHIADVTGEAIVASGAATVTLLGTRFTMTEAFYVDRLTAGRELDVRVPDGETQQAVDRIIFEELVVGRVSERSATWFRNLIAAEARSGSKGVILGCTELPMLVEGYESPLPLFDTTALHAQAAVDFLVG